MNDCSENAPRGVDATALPTVERRTPRRDGAALRDDGYLPIGDRTFAAELTHRLRLRMVVSDDDALRVRRLYEQRRDQLIATVSAYGREPC